MSPGDTDVVRLVWGALLAERLQRQDRLRPRGVGPGANAA